MCSYAEVALPNRRVEAGMYLQYTYTASTPATSVSRDGESSDADQAERQTPAFRVY